MDHKQQYYEALNKKIATLTARTESGADTQDRLLALYEARQMYADALDNPEFRPDEFRAGTPLHHLDTIARGNIADIATGSLIGTGKAVINTAVNGVTSLNDIPAALDAAAQDIKTVAKDVLSDPINFIHGMTMRQRAELAAIYRESTDINAALAEQTQGKTIAAYLTAYSAVNGAKAIGRGAGVLAKAAESLPEPSPIAITPEGTRMLPTSQAGSYAATKPGSAAPALIGAAATAAVSPNAEYKGQPSSAPATTPNNVEKYYNLRETENGDTVWAVVKNIPGTSARKIEVFKANFDDYGNVLPQNLPPVMTATYRIQKGWDEVFTDQIAPVELKIKLPKDVVKGGQTQFKVPLTSEEGNALLREHLGDVLTAIREDAKAQSSRPYVHAVTPSGEVIEGKRRINQAQWHKYLENAELNGHDLLLKQQKTTSLPLSSLESSSPLNPAAIVNAQIALRSLENGLNPAFVMETLRQASTNTQQVNIIQPNNGSLQA